MLLIGRLEEKGGRMKAVVRLTCADAGLGLEPVGYWVDNPRDGYDADGGLKEFVLVALHPDDQFCRIVCLEEVEAVLDSQGAL